METKHELILAREFLKILKVYNLFDKERSIDLIPTSPQAARFASDHRIQSRILLNSNIVHDLNERFPGIKLLNLLTDDYLKFQFDLGTNPSTFLNVVVYNNSTTFTIGTF